MVEYLRETYPVEKIAIVDTDCHHGDGTQDIYWHDPDTLYISLHQDGRTLYPGSGFPNELGGPTAVGSTINIPLPPFTSEEGFLYAVNNIILPILDDFKPDLIVNSAGQDNHFSDPITNMNFSALGYAALTEALRPDIAVLEGGYSIEGALPYVNLGIILSLAGIDYSKVKEPAYDPIKLRQKAEVTDWIRKTGERILENWEQKERIRERIQDGKKIARRTRTIFYDTDNIQEKQMETLRICDSCSGSLRIDSSSDKGRHILAVHIPRKACKTCIETGREWYNSRDASSFEMVFLQDRTTDEYLCRVQS
jgi:hypothetical protein